LAQPALPQENTQPAVTPRERIANELKLIEDAPHWHATDIQIGRLWGHLAFDYQSEGDMQLSEEAYSRAIVFLGTAPSAQSDYATALDNLGSLISR